MIGVIIVLYLGLAAHMVDDPESGSDVAAAFTAAALMGAFGYAMDKLVSALI